MKKLLPALALTVLLVIESFSPVLAAARDTSNRGMDYAVSSASLKQWSFGFYYDQLERDLRMSGRDITLQSDKAMLYLGYDILPWAFPYLAGGRSTSKVGPRVSDAGSEFQYGGGLHFNFLDHEVADPFLLEDRLRLNGNVEYTVTSIQDFDADSNLAELDASLTLSIVNDIPGNVLFMPDSMAVFAGPIYCSITGPKVKGPKKSGDDFGYTVGFELFYTPTISFSGQVNSYDHTGYTVGMNLRF